MAEQYLLDQHFIVATKPKALEENIVVWGKFRVTVLKNRLFRIEKEEKGRFCDQATQSVWYRKFDKVPFTVKKEQDCLTVDTGEAKLVLKETIEESFVILEGCSIPFDNAKNLKGTYRTLDCCDGEWWICEDQKKHIVLENGVVSENGVAVLDDSLSLVLEESGTLNIRNFSEQDIYVFAYGHNYREAVKALFQISGQTPLIPRFALGNWWSRYHAYTEKEYLHVMNDFEEQEIPLTVATVDMDWHWSKTLDQEKNITEQGKNNEFHGGNDGWTGYSWNTRLFPDYRRFLRKLHEKNLHVTLNLHPALGVRYFEDKYSEMAEAMGVDPATEQQIPFDIADSRFINAYFRILHKPLEHDGVDFWWIDWQQGSNSRLAGLDPLWALNHYHYLDNGLEHSPLILSRYCGIGSHRYPLGFSGDTFVTWESLDYLPYFTATASNAGYSWWSHDIGGHMYGSKDDELYVRFVQFGVFSPINRLHSTDSETFTKEPWAYSNGSGLIAAQYLRLRHKMIPFLFSASCRANKEGLALIEPLYYEWAENKEAYQYRNEYLFGGQLLVAPVTQKSKEQGMTVLRIWLPEGKWTDLFTGMEYEGGSEFKMMRWMEEMPVFLREGGFFVLDDRKYTNNVEVPDCLKVYTASGNGEYSLFEQDKEENWYRTKFVSLSEKGIQRVTFTSEILPQETAPNNQKDEINKVHGNSDNQEKKLLGQNAEQNNRSELSSRQYKLWFCNILSAEVEVFADGVSYPAKVDDNGRVSVVIDHTMPGVVYEIVVHYNEEQKEKRAEIVRKTLTKLPMDNNEKAALFGKLRGLSGKEYKKAVQETALIEAAKIRLLEIESMPEN